MKDLHISAWLQLCCRGCRCLQFLWPRALLKKCLHLNSSAEEFSADEHEDTENEADDKDSFSDVEESAAKRHRSFVSRWYMRQGPVASISKIGRAETARTQFMYSQEIRITVGTWNVAGNTLPSDGDLDDWLQTNYPADIYVLGFQEIVPLSAANVFGAEDNGRAAKWQTLIRQTLSKVDCDDVKCCSAPHSPLRQEKNLVADILADAEIDPEHTLIEEVTSFVAPKFPEMQGIHTMQLILNDEPKSIYTSADRIGGNQSHKRTESEPTFWIPKASSATTVVDEHAFSEEEPLLTSLLSPSPVGFRKSTKRMVHYVRVASKQMFGLYICIWVRRKLRRHIRNLTVSCVGIGLMGHLGNKGSISVSMILHQTSFCFICCHLTSGEKEGDELRRNADVLEIHKRTHFPPNLVGIHLPETILAHDRIIWLGDLNYRIDMSDSNVRALVAKKEWHVLLEKDQLKKELSKGHIFDGWCEGPIQFAPTYKYEFNSDKYFGDNAKSREKRRAPAWCDRILWYGRGLEVLNYMRTESKSSDHRPVSATFLADLEVLIDSILNEGLSFRNEKVEIEDLLSYPEIEIEHHRMHFEKVEST